MRRSALSYLERYASTAANLRRIMLRRIERVVRDHPDAREELVNGLDGLIADLEKLGYVDDRRFATTRVRSLRARGLSTRLIRSRLYAKGVSSDLITEVRREEREEQENPDLRAACDYVRRRRLGPIRPDPETRRANRQRDLGRLARAGFSYDICTRVLDLEDVDALHELVGPRRW